MTDLKTDYPSFDEVVSGSGRGWVTSPRREIQEPATMFCSIPLGRTARDGRRFRVVVKEAPGQSLAAEAIADYVASDRLHHPESNTMDPSHD
jgi:hypothetical protein